MKRSNRWLSRLFIGVASVLVVTTCATSPALASDSSSANAQGSAHKNQAQSHAKIADRFVQGLAQLRYKRDGDTSGTTFSVAGVPGGCVGQWEDLELDVDWYYDDDTGITEASDAYWTGYVNCSGMAYTAHALESAAAAVTITPTWA